MLERAEKLSVLAYRKIESMILMGELKPGERFNEHRFAEDNGLSRGPVREACRALELAGLLAPVPGKGSFVREISERQLFEVYQLRAVLTGLMCGLAAERAADEDVSELRKLNRKMAEESRRIDQDGYYAANLEFHDCVARIADNETAKRVYDGLIKETHAHRIAVLSTEDSIREHDAIIEAIAAGDQPGARMLGEQHVLAGMERWKEGRSARIGPPE